MGMLTWWGWYQRCLEVQDQRTGYVLHMRQWVDQIRMAAREKHATRYTQQLVASTALTLVILSRHKQEHSANL